MNISIISKNRKRILGFSLLLWFVVQIYLVITYWNQPQYSDANAYMNSAMQCYMEGHWYPDIDQINNQRYIFNPGFINFLILELKIFGTYAYHGLVGMVLNVILLLSVRVIVNHLINKEAADYAIIFYCLMYSNMVSSIPIMSDLFFTCLLFGSLALIRRNYLSLFLSAFILCYANYTRPILVIFAASILIYMYMKGFGWKRITVFCLSYFVLYISLSVVVSNNTAAKNASGSTLGVNLIQGANDHMNGTVNSAVFQKGDIGWVDKNTNVYQKDSIWRAHAIEWIIQHPVKYMSYAPVKLARLWWGDNYMDLPLNNVSTSNTSKFSKIELLKRASRIVLLSLGYYVVVFFMLLGLWRLRKRIFGYWGIFFIPVILACGMHIVLYGGMRYHYSYIPIFILYATIGLLSLEDKALTFLKK